ncbi:MAG: hypothetical protein JRG96_20985 [Deltaproteobacteria bacterium]|nr:hypothetical protein [Deltaproteobacteria bacterium]MBW2421242.1 hypothetical protein [Deltaproteobacteria bacterium]
MKRVLSNLACVVCLFAITGVSLAEEPKPKPEVSLTGVAVSTGREGGSYYYIGQRLNSEMLLAHNQLIEVVTSDGSLDNLARLHDPRSPVNVALAQADALKSYLKSEPGFAGKFFVLGDVGKECVLLVAGASSSVKSTADLKAQGSRQLSVDSPGSGAAVTFETMGALDPGFRNTATVYVPTMESLLQLRVGGEYSELKALMMVQRPRRVSPALKVVLSDPKSYKLLPITARDLPNDALPDGSKIYSFESVAVGGVKRRGHQQLDTVCTRGLLLGSIPKLSRAQRSTLSELMLNAGERIAGSDE